MAEHGFVVVGGGLAAGKAVHTLRDEGYGGPVVLVAAEPERPYERPPLSKGYLTGSAERGSAFVDDEPGTASTTSRCGCPRRQWAWTRPGTRWC